MSHKSFLSGVPGALNYACFYFGDLDKTKPLLKENYKIFYSRCDSYSCHLSADVARLSFWNVGVGYRGEREKWSQLPLRSCELKAWRHEDDWQTGFDGFHS